MKKNNSFNNRKLLYIMVTLIVIMAILYLGRGFIMQENNNELDNSEITDSQENEERMDNMEGKNPIVTITMASGKEIKIELYPEHAPNTVNNFIYLINQDFYDGLIFHRVIKGFMLQGGDPEGTGTGGPGYSIKGEFSQNGFDNELKHDRGVISMARSMSPDSAGSQFFIMHQDSPHLDGQYAVFGKVIEGLDVVDELANVSTAVQDRPVEEQVMKEVKVETFGIEYDEPDKI